jgi:hypothetical protein
MKLPLTNQNKAERITRFIISLFFLPSFVVLDPSWYSTLVGTVGMILLLNAIIGACYIYRLFGGALRDLIAGQFSCSCVLSDHSFVPSGFRKNS